MAQKILITEEIVPAGIEILKEKGYEVDCKFDLSREELLDIIEDYDALIVRSATKVDREIFEIGKKLRVVGRAGVGIDNIDIEAANAYGVIVCNAPVSNTVSAAEHTMALMLAAARNVAAADACMKAGGWNRRDFTGTGALSQDARHLRPRSHRRTRGRSCSCVRHGSHRLRPVLFA